MKIFYLLGVFILYAANAFTQTIPRMYLSYVLDPGAVSQSIPDLTRDTFHIREVEIVAARKLTDAGLRYSIPDSLALHSGLTTDLSELLSRNTPVFIKSYGRGSQATAHFRGTSASHSGIIWNGMLLNSPMRGYADLSMLPLFFIDHILILHGGSSLTESSGALGGIVHLENLPDWKREKSAKLVVETGSFHTQRYMTRLQWGTPRFLSVTRIFLENSENNFPFFNTGIIPHRMDTLCNGDYHKKAALQEFYYRSENDLTLQLRGWIQQNRRNLPPLMSYEGRPRTEYQKDDQYRVNINMKKYSEKMSWQYTGSLNYARLKYFHQSMADNYVISDALSSEESWFNQIRFQYRMSRFLFNSSVEGSFFQVESNEKVKREGYEEKRLETGFLIHIQYQPSDRTGLYILSRSESFDRKVIPFIPSIGLDWQVRKQLPLFLKMNLTRNYHKPGLNDLYWNPGGNPDLLPEEGFTGEIMLSSPWKSRSFSFTQECSWYFSGIRNWIMWQPAASGAWYWEATNIDKVNSFGVEYNFSGSIDLGRWKIRSGGNYAFTRTYRSEDQKMNDSSLKSQLIYIPKHTANLHFAFNFRNWSLLTDLAFTGKRYTRMDTRENFPGSSLPPFLLLNTSLQRQFAWKSMQWGLKWKVENLLNTRYQQVLWRPMPERNYTLTILLGIEK